MLNGGAGAGKRADYSDVAGRQTRRRPGPLPSRWPRLIPPRIARRFSARLRFLTNGDAAFSFEFAPVGHVDRQFWRLG